MVQFAGEDTHGTGLPKGYLSQLLGQMAVNDGAKPGPVSIGTAVDDDMVGLDLPPGDVIDEGVAPGADDASGPHAGTAETDEDEYQIYGDDDENEEGDVDLDESR